VPTSLPPPSPADATVGSEAPTAATSAVAVMEDVTRVFAGGGGVRDATLAVPAGSVVGLIGPSGSGKTTLVRLIAGLDAPTSGSVEVFGKDPTTFTWAESQRLGYLPQLPVLFPNLSLRENLGFIASIYGVRRRRRQLAHLLALVGLDQDASTRFAHASGGMQRRLGLAAALVHEPELLLLDEPTAGIDPILRSRFWQHFRDLRSAGRTLVISTQYVTEAAECDHVAVVVDGRVALVAPPDELVARSGIERHGNDPIDYDEVFVHLVRAARRSEVATVAGR
jgi:ABC-2 type transport system ATP-binding protein